MFGEMEEHLLVTKDSTSSHVIEYFARQLDDNLSPQSRHGDEIAAVHKIVRAYSVYSAQKASELQSSKASVIRARHAVPTPVDTSSTTAGGLRHWQLEADTWNLLARIIPVRHMHSTTDQPRMMPHPRSRKQYMSNFLLADSTASERKCVLEWLESTAASAFPAEDGSASSTMQNDILSCGWIHTRTALKGQKLSGKGSGALFSTGTGFFEKSSFQPTSALVTSLDPDAVTRQQKKLRPEDEKYEHAVWQGCFSLLRQGKSAAEIADWCRDRGELWRAAFMSMSMFCPSDNSRDSATCDPAALVLMRRMAYAAAHNEAASRYERAVYGVLAGDIESVEAICQSWDDMVFAHYNALLCAQFDNYLVHTCPSANIASICQMFPCYNAVNVRSDPPSLRQFLVNTLGPTSNLVVRHKSSLKTLQAAIVTGTLDDFFFQQGLVLAKEANRSQTSKVIQDYGHDMTAVDKTSFAGLGDSEALRVIAHVLIITNALKGSPKTKRRVSSAAHDTREQVRQNIIAAYTVTMRMSGLDHLVPLYCAKLVGARAYDVLGRNLIHVNDAKSQQMQLDLMTKFGLDPDLFVRHQAKLFLDDVCGKEIATKDNPDTAGHSFSILGSGAPSLKYGRPLLVDFIDEDSTEEIDQQDEWLIRSMEWMCLRRGLWVDTFAHGIRIYKYFYSNLRLLPARMLTSRVPCAAIFQHKSQIIVPDEIGPGWYDELESTIEGTVELESESDLNRGRMIAVARPYWEFECLSKTLDLIETLSSLIQISRESKATQRDFWSKVATDVKLVKGYMGPLLRGWLLTDVTAEAEVVRLRRMYLPEVVLAYISVLHFAGTSLSRDNLLECMDLASAIADEEICDVAGLFSEGGRMKELMTAFAACSKAIAVKGEDKRATSSKKLKEMGWSRDLWAVRQP